MLIILYRALQPSTMVVDVFRAKTSDSVLYIIKLQSITLLNGTIIRGEPERAPNTRGTGSGFICIYIYMFVG